MFFQILNKFTSNGKQPEINHGLALATLFIQLANADNDYSSEEHELIIKILVNRYNVERSEAEKIIDQAADQISNFVKKAKIDNLSQ